MTTATRTQIRILWPTINLLFGLVALVLLFSPAPWWTVEAFSIPAIVGGVMYHLRYTRKARS